MTGRAVTGRQESGGGDERWEVTEGSSLRPIVSARMLATVTAHHHRPSGAHRRRSSVTRRHCPSPLLLPPSRHRPSPLVCSPPPPPPPVTVRCQPAPAIPLPPVTVSPLICSSVTDRHRWSAARRHRPSPRACSCRPITTRHRWSVARRHCSSPPACHPPVPSPPALHSFHLDGDGELHTGGLTCCRPPAASPPPAKAHIASSLPLEPLGAFIG